MGTIKWTVAFPMFAADQLLPLAQAAEEAGFDAITVPDSVFFPEHVTGDYPYTPDGDRRFLEDKPFLEPFSLIPALAAVTTRIRFATFVLKLPVRHPLLVALVCTSIALAPSPAAFALRAAALLLDNPAGENAHRILEDANGVEMLATLGSWNGLALNFAIQPPADGEGVAVLVQAPDGRMLGAAAILGSG